MHPFKAKAVPTVLVVFLVTTALFLFLNFILKGDF